MGKEKRGRQGSSPGSNKKRGHLGLLLVPLHRGGKEKKGEDMHTPKEMRKEKEKKCSIVLITHEYDHQYQAAAKKIRGKKGGNTERSNRS